MVKTCKQWWPQHDSLGQEEVEHSPHYHEHHCPCCNVGVGHLLDTLHPIVRFVPIFVKLSFVSVFPQRVVFEYSEGKKSIKLIKTGIIWYLLDPIMIFVLLSAMFEKI